MTFLFNGFLQMLPKIKLPIIYYSLAFFFLLIISAFNGERFDCFRVGVFSSKSNDSQRKSLREEGEKPGWAAGSVPPSARLLASCPPENACSCQDSTNKLEMGQTRFNSGQLGSICYGTGHFIYYLLNRLLFLWCWTIL